VTNQTLTGVVVEVESEGSTGSQTVDIPSPKLFSALIEPSHATNVWCHISGNGVSALSVRMGLCILEASPDDRCHTFVPAY